MGASEAGIAVKFENTDSNGDSGQLQGTRNNFRNTGITLLKRHRPLTKGWERFEVSKKEEN